KETTLCNGDQDRTIKAQVKQRKKNVPPALGETEFTLREVISGDRKFMFRPTEKGKIGKDAHLRVIKGLVTEPPSFLDYISGGTQINLVVAIDFTGSNGDPRSKTSLHYTGGSRDNEYQSAIRSPEVQGVDGILEAYSRTFDALELYGPTNFSPIINQTADKIKQELRSGNKRSYYLLLIITDMDSTVKAIINATSLPLSIIIVGVGNADFANMNVLDADDNPLKVMMMIYGHGVILSLGQGILLWSIFGTSKKAAIFLPCYYVTPVSLNSYDIPQEHMTVTDNLSDSSMTITTITDEGTETSRNSRNCMLEKEDLDGMNK
ncbi:2952_t:CDS:2, partial [Dentiscutata erythropus]